MATRKKKAPKKSMALTFNHAMVYSRDIERALGFYRDRLGFNVVEEMDYGGRKVYARLRASRGDGTIALHLLEPGKTLSGDQGIRLYLETKDLDSLCHRLRNDGVQFSQMPKTMPWGWKHAYLDDPDGHQLSLYWAGAKRFRKGKMAV